MSISNMTVDNEFRYIVQWFNECSELQREDFISALYDYLIGTSTVSKLDVTQMNNLAHDMNKALIVNDRPMSLFQCRLKLFRQWHPKWPLEFKTKLQKKIMEIDTKLGEKLRQMIEGSDVNGAENLSENNCSTTSLNVTANDASGTDSCTTDVHVNVHGDLEVDIVVMDKPVQKAIVLDEQQVFNKELPVNLLIHAPQQQLQQQSQPQKQADNTAIATINLMNKQVTTPSVTTLTKNADIPLIA